MLSARAGEEAKVGGLKAGADDYLTKPFSARELLARVASGISLARVRREAADAVMASETALRALNEQLEARIAHAIAEREKVEDALRQAQKMEAVGQLTGGIAHDFNNLLTVITGNVDMARRALGSGETSRAGRALDNAQKGAARAAALTQRLLAFSRRQPLAPKFVNMDRLVTGMADLLHRALGEQVQLETVSTPGLWRVEADPNQLESAILNLAVNARDAMPEGGKLTIETANARLDEQYSAAHAEVAPGSYVVVAVTDTGTGMSKETLARVFDPFFTTKGVGKGTGLGLSMVYGFVKQSGGHVKIYSEPNEGTTVKIYLPRVMNAVEADEKDEAADVDRMRRQQRILVVEDDDDVRAYTVEILRELGYRVLEAHDGPSAMRLLDRQEQRVDLLFTDIVMPGQSGRELADAARRTHPTIKVLFTSGYTPGAILRGGRVEPGVEIIAKPFTYQALAGKIADVLDAGRTGRVLIVESDETLRMFAVEALLGAGNAVDEAATASEALGLVRASGGRYDAVLLDVPLAEKGGEFACRRVEIALRRSADPDRRRRVRRSHARALRGRPMRGGDPKTLQRGRAPVCARRAQSALRRRSRPQVARSAEVKGAPARGPRSRRRTGTPSPRRIPVGRLRLRAVDDHELVGEHPVAGARLAIGPLHPDFRPLGGAKTDMDEARVAGGVAAADVDEARLALGSRPDRDPRSDGVAVGVRFDEFDLAPVAHRQRRVVAVLGAEVAVKRDVRAAVDLQDVELPVEVEIGDQRPAALESVGDPRLVAGLGEFAVELAEKQVARIIGGEVRHLLEIALGDEDVEEPGVVEVGEFSVPGGRRPLVGARVGNMRGRSDLAGDVSVDRRLPAVAAIGIELLQLLVAHRGEEIFRVARAVEVALGDAHAVDRQMPPAVGAGIEAGRLARIRCATSALRRRGNIAGRWRPAATARPTCSSR